MKTEKVLYALVLSLAASTVMAEPWTASPAGKQVEAQLKRINSHAQVTFSNLPLDRIAFTVHCTNETERLTVRDAMIELAGSASSTKEPPTVRVIIPSSGAVRPASMTTVEVRARAQTLDEQVQAKIRGNARYDLERKMKPELAKLQLEIPELEAQIEQDQTSIDAQDAVTPTGAGGDPGWVAAIMARRSNVNSAQVANNQRRKTLNTMKQRAADLTEEIKQTEAQLNE